MEMDAKITKIHLQKGEEIIIYAPRGNIKLKVNENGTITKKLENYSIPRSAKK